MRFLWVTAEAPNRSLGGGSIRQSYLLESLAGVAEVDLLFGTNGPREDEAVAAATRTSRIVEVPPPRSLSHTQQRLRTLAGLTPLGPTERQESAAAVRRLRRPLVGMIATGGYDAVLVHHPGLSPLMSVDRAQRWCLETQHLLSRDLGQMLGIDAGQRQRWVRERELVAARRFEDRACRLADLVVTVSDEDSAALPVPSVVVPNGADLARWSALPMELTRQPRAVFTGTLGYGPNVDGLLWLCNEIWPEVKKAIPDAVLDIVGRDPLPEILALGRREGISVTPNVPDTVPYVTQARVALVPLRFGSGTRLKAIEALASGRQVVGTPIGLEGLGLRDGRDALISDTTAGLVDRLVRALGDNPSAAELQRGGRAAAARFGWTELGTLHSEALIGLGGGPRRRR